jgi:hypothetical protein
VTYVGPASTVIDVRVCYDSGVEKLIEYYCAAPRIFIYSSASMRCDDMIMIMMIMIQCSVSALGSAENAQRAEAQLRG